MKYIDADKLKAELYKRIGKYDSMLHEWSMPVVKGKREEAFELLTLVESLQQEQPEVGWVEEIDKVWNNGLSDELAGPHNDFNICARLARHFYELGLNARKED